MDRYKLPDKNAEGPRKARAVSSGRCQKCGDRISERQARIGAGWCDPCGNEARRRAELAEPKPPRMSWWRR